MKTLLLLSTFLFCILFSNAQPSNLINNGDFTSLKSWKQNANLRKNGKVTLLRDEKGVTLFNPVIDMDGSIYQEVLTEGHDWFYYSTGLKSFWGEASGAAISFVALDHSGTELKTFMLSRDAAPRPFRSNYRFYEGNIQMPPGTVKIRAVLTVLGGKASFSDVILYKAEGPAGIASRKNLITEKGFSVDAFAVERPFWKMFVDDLDGDGIPEIISCDVDGIITVRNQGKPAMLTYAAEALVYQFYAADLNNNGIKEILISSVDPKIPVKAIDLSGKTVMEFPESKGPERIAAADMDGNGYVEVAISRKNLVAGSGVADGLTLYNNSGDKLWEKTELLRNFHFADILPHPGKELVVGGPRIEFRMYNKEGESLDNIFLESTNLSNFSIADVNSDGRKNIIASVATAESAITKLMCIDGDKIVWENTVLKQLGNPENYIAVGEFATDIPGLETVVVSAHNVFLYDASGTIIYESREESNWEYWESFTPEGINSLDIGFWNKNDPHLYLSSSRFRHSAYYKLSYGVKDELKTYLLPDQEKHLEDIYHSLKQQPARPATTNEKIKVFIANDGIMNVPEETLKTWRKVLDTLETNGVEYLLMSTASDLKGHRRGHKMTTEQIIERARLLEKTGIPFGYFLCHSGQPWTSEAAIKGTRQAAPTMFRFIYLAENLETLYSPLYTEALKWTHKTLEYCSQNNLKVIFKEKHDVWGLLLSDPEVTDIILNPKYKDVTVPIWSTNQPYQPEIQLGGMLGLKMTGLCSEFGMSTQYWNWHEWGRYPRGIRDVSAYSVCPSDIILRLELMGIALGATWIHIEGGQPYLEKNFEDGLVPLAKRHRDLAYELVRKNFLIPGEVPENINKAAVVRLFHDEFEKGKSENKRIAYPYYERNTEALRRGFIPARFQFETYSPDAFPWIAYSMESNSKTCFPQTPYGWIQILPTFAKLLENQLPIFTDGEKIRDNLIWKESSEVSTEIERIISSGAEDIILAAPGTCLILKKDNSKPGLYTVLLIDPGYLAPTGVSTTLVSRKGDIQKVTDLINGKPLKFKGNSCPVQIEPGAFRILAIEINIDLRE